MFVLSHILWHTHKRQCPRTSDLLTTSEQSLFYSKAKSGKDSFIRHFDAQTMDFLDKIRPLLTALRIGMGSISPNRLENLRTILTRLAPSLVDGIQSLQCADGTALSMVKNQLFHEPNKLAKLKMFEFEMDSFYSDNGTGLFFYIV